MPLVRRTTLILILPLKIEPHTTKTWYCELEVILIVYSHTFAHEEHFRNNIYFA